MVIKLINYFSEHQIEGLGTSVLAFVIGFINFDFETLELASKVIIRLGQVIIIVVGVITALLTFLGAKKKYSYYKDKEKGE